MDNHMENNHKENDYKGALKEFKGGECICIEIFTII